MSRKYSFSIKGGNETLEASGFDSFDEAFKACEKGVADRMRILKEREVQAREDDATRVVAPPVTPPGRKPYTVPSSDSDLASAIKK